MMLFRFYNDIIKMNFCLRTFQMIALKALCDNLTFGGKF